MGPGTPIIDRLYQGVIPVDHVDEVAMYHDIDYTTSEEPIFSDLRAIAGSFKVDTFKELVEAEAMRLGLGVRSIVDAILHTLPFMPNVTHINEELGVSKEDLLTLAKQLKPTI